MSVTKAEVHEPNEEQVKLACEWLKQTDDVDYISGEKLLAELLASHDAELAERVREETLEEAAREAESFDGIPPMTIAARIRAKRKEVPSGG